MVGLIWAILAGCAEDGVDPVALETDAVWDGETFGVALQLHDGSQERAGQACVDGRCVDSDEGGLVWLDGLDQGEHTVDLLVDGSDPSMTAVTIENHDRWIVGSIQAYDQGLVDRFLPPVAWQRYSTGLVDLWVRDESIGAEPMGGALIEIDAGDVYVSDGGDAITGTVTLDGGPAWITNLPPGEVEIRVSAPGYACRQKIVGWPVEGDTSALRLPVEAGIITSAWISCTPVL